jgi:DNA-binding GntR family transcriptional regulator
MTFATVPLYLQVGNEVARRIKDGTYTGTLPNEHDLSREFQVSSGTVRKALDSLEARGIIDRRQGRGTFVRADVPKLPDTAKALISALGTFNVETRDGVVRAITAKVHDLAVAGK